MSRSATPPMPLLEPSNRPRVRPYAWRLGLVLTAFAVVLQGLGLALQALDHPSTRAVLVVAGLLFVIALVALLRAREQVVHLLEESRDLIAERRLPVRKLPSGDALDHLGVTARSAMHALDANLVDLEDAHGRLVRDLERNNQELRTAMQLAEAATKAKSEFLANMSHEIRTPMNAILGLTSLCLEGTTDRTQREQLTTVRSAAESLLEVLNDILDFSKIEAGKLDFEASEFSLKEVLADTVKPLALRADERGIELVVRVDREIPDSVVTDPVRLRQVLNNLLSNAIKFTERGEIVISVERVDEDAGGLLLRCSVRDTGVGIPSAQLQRVFEAFTQADGSGTRRFGGTGLGLTIARRVVAMLGGEISVQSEVGRGSTFVFTFRCTAGKTRDRLPKLWPEGLRALVLDDNPTCRESLCAMLRSFGAEATACFAPDDAATVVKEAAAAREPIQLAIVDAFMPLSSGAEAVRRLRAASCEPPAVILLATATRLRETSAVAKELGNLPVLLKPVRSSDLHDAIADLGLAVAEIAPPEAKVSEPTRPGRPLRILLAEDNPMNVRVATTLLARSGHAIAVAVDGAECVRRALSEPFDLILMDVQMPELDGLGAARAIRAHERDTGAHVPILALTANAMKGDEDECRAAGMDAYLPKPLRAGQLEAAIAKLVEPRSEGSGS